MLRIAVCDDHNSICSQVEDFAINTCNGLGIQCEVDVYYDGGSLCTAIENGELYELIFLDIEMRNVNGVEVGMKIREEYNNQLMQIVYISGKKKYAMELFRIRPFDFLIKPLNKENIEKVINKFLKTTNFWSEIFTYKKGHCSVKVKIKDIKYLESVGRKIILHLNDRKEVFYGVLEEVYTESLQKYDFFLFIHKSYIVNYDYVYSSEYSRLFLSDGEELPISQPKRKEIRALQKALEKRRT